THTLCIVEPVFPLRHNSSQIFPACELEQLLASFFEVIHIKECGWRTGNNALQLPLTRDERQGTQVFALEFQDVECIEVRRASAIQQRFELTLSVTIQTDDLAVQYGTLDVEALGNLFRQGPEALVNIPRARDELA